MRHGIQFNAGSRALLFAREPMFIRVIAALLIFPLLFVLPSTVPAAFAEDVVDVVDGLKWTVAEGGILTKVEADENTIEGEITIPSSVQGRQILIIGTANGGANLFNNNKLITKITIPEGVTDIASGTSGSNSIFGRCTQLTEVIFPNSLLTLGNWAFQNCTAMTDIKFGDSSQLESIGNHTFNGCTSLVSITLPNSLKTTGTSFLYNCTSLASITIPSSLETIGNGFLYNCTSITSITIPATVKTIGANFCYGCTSLEEVFFYAMS